MSRPLAPLPDDPKVARRRRQYRNSKRRHYERLRHAEGRCKQPCALVRIIDDDDIPRVAVPRKNGDGYVYLPA